MSNTSTTPIKDRKVSSVLIENFKFYAVHGEQLAEATVHFFLTTSDGSPDGPKAVVPIATPVLLSDSIGAIHERLIEKARAVLLKASESSAKQLYDMWALQIQETPPDDMQLDLR